MKYIIKRKSQEVIVGIHEASDACALGFQFAFDYPKLVAAGWGVYCTGPYERDEAGMETYYTGYVSGVYRAKHIAKRIMNLPRSPHDCPDCKCKPECCK